MDVQGHIIVTNETKEKAYEKLQERLNELGFEYETSEREVTFTEIKVTLKLSKLRMIKHLFTLVGAPEQEIKYLSKVASVVKATAEDLLRNLFQSIKGV